MKTIDDYEKKILTVADFINHTDGKVVIIIMDENNIPLYDGRQEYLAWTEKGMADKLCDRVVDYFDISNSNNGKLVLYLKEVE